MSIWRCSLLKLVHLKGFSLDYVSAFSALPSIKLVTAPDSIYSNGASKGDIAPTPRCYVTNLELYERIVSPGDLHDLLPRCKDQQSFAYSHINY